MKTLIQTVAIAVATITFSSCGNPGGIFVGAYDSTGEATMVESGGKGRTGKISGTFTFVEGLSSDLVLIDEVDCQLPFQAENLGKTATIVEGTTCLKDLNGVTQSWTYSSGTATRGESEIKLLLMGDYAFQYPGYPVQTSTFTMEMTLTRIGK